MRMCVITKMFIARCVLLVSEKTHSHIEVGTAYAGSDRDPSSRDIRCKIVTCVALAPLRRIRRAAPDPAAPTKGPEGRPRTRLTRFRLGGKRL